MTPRSLANSTFNASPTCAGFGPTQTVSPAFATAQAAVFMTACCLYAASFAQLLCMRPRFNRLKKRSLFPTVFSFVSAVGVVLTRSYYDLVGRQYFDCGYALLLYYVASPGAILGELVGFAIYVFELDQRRKLGAALVRETDAATPLLSNTANQVAPFVPPSSSKHHGKVSGESAHGAPSPRSAGAAGGKNSNSSASSHHLIVAGASPAPASPAPGGDPLAAGLARPSPSVRNLLSTLPEPPPGGGRTVRSWLRGFRAFALGNNPLCSRSHQHAHGRAEELVTDRVVLLSYEVVAVALLMLPSFAALFARLATDPIFTAGCTGCPVQLTDLVVVLGLALVPYPLTLRMALKIWNRPDPLGYMGSVVFTLAVGAPLGLIGAVVTYVDPGGLMRAQDVDWFVLEMSTLLLLLFPRLPGLVVRTLRVHREKVSNLRLLDVLSDQRGALLFERFLASELAVENLTFWVQTSKWKLSYDRKDFATTQQMARILFKTFVEADATLAINISEPTRVALEQRFRGAKVVSRTVFDDALVEIYRVMETGPFRRFCETAEFAAFKAKMTDYSLSTAGVFNVTSLSSTAGLKGPVASSTEARAAFDVARYVASL